MEFTNDLELVISSVNNKPQGMSKEINPEMFMLILPKLQKSFKTEIKDGWKPTKKRQLYRGDVNASRYATSIIEE